MIVYSLIVYSPGSVSIFSDTEFSLGYPPLSRPGIYTHGNSFSPPISQTKDTTSGLMESIVASMLMMIINLTELNEE